MHSNLITGLQDGVQLTDAVNIRKLDAHIATAINNLTLHSISDNKISDGPIWCSGQYLMNVRPAIQAG